MTSISILGTGNMGGAIASVFADTETIVETVSHADTPTSFTGDIVVLAVPYVALADIAATYREQLAGKIVVDITNTVDFASFGPLDIAAGSAAAELAAALPDSRIVKALNTNFAATLASKNVAGITTTVLVTSDDADAKATLSAALTAAGLNVLDAGPLARAHELEAVGYLQLVLAATEQIGWSDALGVIK